jgi:hypothetical protein
MQDLVEADNGTEYLKTMAEARNTAINSLNNDPVDAQVDQALEAFDPDCWNDTQYHRLPAELATLYKIIRPNAVEQEAEFVFIGSTGSNLAEATLCQRMFAKICADQALGFNSRLHKLANNWSPTPSGSFPAAMEETYALARTIFGNNEGPVPRFVVSGGYKAIVMDLAIHVCAKLIERDCHFYYLNDEGEDIVHLQLRRDENNRPYLCSLVG